MGEIENQWVIQMTSILKRQAVNYLEYPLSIFQVPSSMTQVKPEAYNPQVVALGPYHHLTIKPYHMQECKLDMALQAQEHLQIRDFGELFKALKEKAEAIGARYEQLPNMSADTFTCIMAIDGLFLLELIYKQEKFFTVVKPPPRPPVSAQPLIEGSGDIHSELSGNVQVQILRKKETTDQVEEIPEQSSATVDDPPKFIGAAGREHSLVEIMRDIVMLENQIPTIVLETLLKKSQDEFIADDLNSRLVDLCTRISPIELKGNSPPTQVDKNWHLLDALYILVWFGKMQVDMSIRTLPVEIVRKAPSDREYWSELWKNVKKLNVGFIGIFAAVFDLFLNVLNMLGISISLDTSQEEFLLPSASKLQKVGMKFTPIGPDGIKDIKFDKELVSLALPVLNYDPKLSEVIVRNLLAYETLATPESPKIAGYIEMMAGLVSAVEDVEVLGRAKVLPSTVNASEVIKLLGGLVSSESNKGSNNESEVIKEAIDGVNEYYNNSRKVRTQKLLKKYLSVSWKVLTVFAILLLLLLMALQTFCSIYRCPKLFKTG